MPSSPKPRPLLLFYVLVTYVFLQFGWWTYMLIQLNNEVYAQKSLVIRMQSTQLPVIPGTEQLALQEAELSDRLHKRWLMILGEGAVFSVLLVLGIMRTRSSFKKEAALAEQQKNFLLSVTHELKSPLASARLQHETLLHRELPREKQKEILESAIEDIDRLHTLVENILLAARIDNHTNSLHPETCDFSKLVEELAEKNAPSIRRTHPFEITLEPGIDVRVDKLSFPSILLNLLENAVKYSPAGSAIRISLAVKNNKIMLAVADRGTGIPGEDKLKVFDKFYRAGSEETRNTKGTGLGLYIVKSLIDAQGWQIAIKDNPGGGTVFEIEIPKAV
ncbi:MAG: integral membrane sensor signal transduction histidine kinase [Bacteroidetes bacterium]|nr:MAG: integral membrane sensor signal transduction histidine kinase [Bacteroidota bacterium]